MLTHDRWIFCHWFFVLLEVPLQHFFLFLHFLLDFFIKILIFLVIALSNLLIVCHNYN